MASRYLFVSTSSSAQMNANTLAVMKRHFGATVLALKVGSSGQYWSNGFVLKLYSSDPVHKWKAWLTDSLKNVTEFWLLHDGAGHGIDNMSEGPGLMAMQKLGSRSICQLFLRYDRSNPKREEQVTKLMKNFEEHRVNCKGVFHFNNGSIHALTTLEDCQTTFRRCEAGLKAPIEFALIDARGECRGSNGYIAEEIAWKNLEPAPAQFSIFSL